MKKLMTCFVLLVMCSSSFAAVLEINNKTQTSLTHPKFNPTVCYHITYKNGQHSLDGANNACLAPDAITRFNVVDANGQPAKEINALITFTDENIGKLGEEIISDNQAIFQINNNGADTSVLRDTSGVNDVSLTVINFP